MSVGIGYDSHRLVKQRPLVLAGVTVPYEFGLLGHSDADVLTHAVIDALLGAAALGDIGQLFPDSDERYLNISSLLLLQQVRQLLADQGRAIVNIDATVILERPKLGPHITAMREQLAASLQLDLGRVSVKAKTNEGMGFVGQAEGAAAIAVAEVKLNE